MSSRRAHGRWIALIAAIAIVASAVITFTLVRITSPSEPDSSVTTTSVPTPTVTSTKPPSVTPSASESSGVVETSTPPTSPTPSDTPAESAQTLTTSAAPLTTATSTLPGSGVTLPAAWSGTAKVTITVLGDCSTSTPSVYNDVPANLALDLTQNELASALVPPTTTVPTDEPTLTLGIGSEGLPKISVYTSAIDPENGVFHDYWDIHLAERGVRTTIDATSNDPPASGADPNSLADSETSLQPCESAGTVSLPRVLAAGSTVTGWVSDAAASLTLRATTTDGKRSLVAEFTADRHRPGQTSAG